jgi:hypothetical protein
VNFSFLSDPKYDFIGAFWMTVQLIRGAPVAPIARPAIAPAAHA